MHRLVCSVLAIAALAAAPAFGAGKLIYAGSCGGICVLPDDGSAAPALVLEAGDYPRWSPDGTRFAYRTTGSGGFQIATAAADGSDVHVVTSDGAADRVNSVPAWSPDGGQLVFTQATKAGARVRSSIRLMNADGGAQRALFRGGTELDGRPVFSPDGQRILFIRSAGGDASDRFTAKLDGSGLRRVATGGPFGAAVPSPDGRRYAFTLRPAGTTRSEIWVADTDGRSLRRVARAGKWSFPTWSSDGLALIAERPGQQAGSAVTAYRIALVSGDQPVPLAGTSGFLHAPGFVDWWAAGQRATPTADELPPMLVIFSGAPVASSNYTPGSTTSARARVALVHLRAGSPQRPIVAKRALLRFAVVDRSGIARFEVIARPVYSRGRCHRAVSKLSAPFTCRAREYVARSPGALRALPHKLRPGRYELFVRTRDVLGNRPKFTLRGTLVVKR